MWRRKTPSLYGTTPKTLRFVSPYGRTSRACHNSRLKHPMKAIVAALEAGLAMPQSLPNGSPYPEAVSLAKLMKNRSAPARRLAKYLYRHRYAESAPQGEGEAPYSRLPRYRMPTGCIYDVYNSRQ